jgi:hypothetical protein
MMLGYPGPIVVPHKLTYPAAGRIPQTFLRDIAGTGVLLVWKVRQAAAPSGHFMNPHQAKTADEQDRPTVSWVETVASLLLRPRFALATAGTLLVLGVLLGSLNGAASARQTAQQRYVATVVMPVAH